jgi:hypothetical protein
MLQGAIVGSRPPERLGQWPTSPIQIWQIFGKMDFYDNFPDEEKVWITAYLLVI